MKNIETKWLYDFLTLEAGRHFSQAAKERNLSQPAFSRRIKALEAAIGVVLFDRTTTPLQLTEEGKLFHSQTRSLLQQLECNLGELNGQSLLGVPNIKIAAAHSLSLSVLPKLVHSLTAYGGEFVYHVEAIDVVQAVNTLREGKSDFIISFRDEDLMQSPFCCLKLFESELYPVCAADAQGHPVFDITQPQVSFAQLYRHILYGQVGQSSSGRGWRYYRAHDIYLFDERVIKEYGAQRIRHCLVTDLVDRR